MTEKEWDERLIDFMKQEMTAKMEKNRAKGRSGWWSDECLDDEELGEMLMEHLGKLQFLDAAILAGMIHFREKIRAEGKL